MRSGGTPNFSITVSRSLTVSVMVLTRVTWSLTSWAMSLSPVEITTGTPCSAACRARVPITSSASTPSITSSGRPMASMMAWMAGIWAARSSGMGGRLALYSAYISLRKVGPLASKTTAMRSGS